MLSREADIEIVGEAASARDAYTVIEETKPDVVIIDVSLPGNDGFAATREILRRVPTCKILVLTMHANEDYAAQALSAGASGYALKDQATDDVVNAIRAVARNETYFAPRFSVDALVDYIQQRARRGGEKRTPLDELTTREQEIFNLAVRGFSNEGIAGELGISVKTVETHRARINRKLNVHCTGDLVRLAARHGLIQEL
ncbi:response regulator transcription factor [Myxococcota bacterium]|nr:response regulator transcription factor [Myxococcota bacterium]